MFLYPLADNLAVFTLLRFLEGIFEGFAVVSLNTMVLALSDRESRGHKMGLFGSAIGLGFILGPAFGSVVYMYLGMDYVFWLTAALALVAVVFLYCIRSSFETESPESTVNTQVETVSKFKSYITLLPYYLPMVLRRVVFFSFHMLLPLTL